MAKDQYGEPRKDGHPLQFPLHSGNICRLTVRKYFERVARPGRFELPTLCLEVAWVLLSKLAGVSAKQGKISAL
jgi:hypothetical protein